MNAIHIPIDRIVGAAIKRRRKQMGMSQVDLGHAVELGFQQIRKYERGDSSITVARLWRFAEVMDVPIAYFFQDLVQNTALPVPTATDADQIQYLFERIDHADVRRTLLELTRVVAAFEPPKPWRTPE